MVWPCKQNASGKVSQTRRKRLVGWPRTRWEDYIEDLGWSRFGLQPSEMLEVVSGRDVWRLKTLAAAPRTVTDMGGLWKKKFCLWSCSWELPLYMNKHEAKFTLLIVWQLLHVLFTTGTLIARICSYTENLKLGSSAEAGIVFNLFLNFQQKWASCSYKIFLIKNCTS